MKPITTLNILLLAILMAGFTHSQAQASDKPTTDQRAEFFRIKAERDKLYHQLDQVIQHAAAQKKQGHKPVEMLAQIESLKDQIEQKEERLRTLGVRYGMAVPPPPERTAGRNGSGGQDPEDYFRGGQAEVTKHLRIECYRFLTHLDFVPFLNATDLGEDVEGGDVDVEVDVD